MTTPAVNLTACHFRQVRWSRPLASCYRCQGPARRIGEATRTAIDVALEQPVLLLVAVSVHRCPACRRTFRLQPPFLRPDAVYSKRVVAKAVASVYEDGMAFRRVAARLARDFWVQPSEGMIRRWCRAYAAGLDFAGDYQPWVVGEFSGVLCVDEVYQDRLALLLAVDPASPDGDRLVGYQLVHGPVGRDDMVRFLDGLRQVGVQPDQVITDGSPLYPGVVAAVWPHAAHQLCLFHQTRRLTKAVRQAIAAIRTSLPPLPPGFRAAGARTPTGAPPADVASPAPPAAGSVQRRGRGRCRRDLRQAGIAMVHALRRQGGSVQGIARQTGISRPTVRSWLQQPDPGTAGEAPPAPIRLDVIAPPAPPPAPWDSWEQVHRVRRGVGADRFRLLCRPEHLTADDRAAFATLFASPVGPQLQGVRSFLEEWYGIWRDASGAQRSRAEAQARYEHWHRNPAYGAIPPLRKVQQHLDAAQFGQLSHFLEHPTWEATSNGAERGGRAFRHRQVPHFNLRGAPAIEQALKAEAALRKEVASGQRARGAVRCTRGRPRHRGASIETTA